MSDPASMSNAAMWSGIVGFLMPIVISVVVQTKWNDAQKAVAAFGACLIAATGTAWFSGLLDVSDVARCFLIVFTLAMATYYGFWKPIGVAPRIEQMTSR